MAGTGSRRAPGSGHTLARRARPRALARHAAQSTSARHRGFFASPPPASSGGPPSAADAAAAAASPSPSAPASPSCLSLGGTVGAGDAEADPATGATTLSSLAPARAAISRRSMAVAVVVVAPVAS